MKFIWRTSWLNIWTCSKTRLLESSLSTTKFVIYLAYIFSFFIFSFNGENNLMISCCLPWERHTRTSLKSEWRVMDKTPSLNEWLAIHLHSTGPWVLCQCDTMCLYPHNSPWQQLGVQHFIKVLRYHFGIYFTQAFQILLVVMPPGSLGTTSIGENSNRNFHHFLISEVQIREKPLSPFLFISNGWRRDY